MDIIEDTVTTIFVITLIFTIIIVALCLLQGADFKSIPKRYKSRRRERDRKKVDSRDEEEHCRKCSSEKSIKPKVYKKLNQIDSDTDVTTDLSTDTDETADVSDDKEVKKYTNSVKKPSPPPPPPPLPSTLPPPTVSQQFQYPYIILGQPIITSPPFSTQFLPQALLNGQQTTNWLSNASFNSGRNSPVPIIQNPSKKAGDGATSGIQSKVAERISKNRSQPRRSAKEIATRHGVKLSVELKKFKKMIDELKEKALERIDRLDPVNRESYQLEDDET